MNATLLIVLLATVAFLAVNSSIPEYDQVSPSRLLAEIEMELATENFGKPMSRSRRVPGNKSCGRHLLKYVLAVCGGACTADSNVDLSTHCCANQCSDEFIREACCP